MDFCENSLGYSASFSLNENNSEVAESSSESSEAVDPINVDLLPNSSMEFPEGDSEMVEIEQVTQNCLPQYQGQYFLIIE